jgi:hypothetical protein
MKKVYRHIIQFLILTGLISAQSPEPQLSERESQWGKYRFIEFIPGDMPVILSVPHGGWMVPDFMPDRRSGVSKKDAGTQEFTEAMVTAMIERTGKRPFIIVNHLHRKKLDPNREIGEAAEGNIVAETAWNEYHAFIDSAKRMSVRQFGKGFYADIHGHGHKNQRVEIGYGLNSDELNVPDAELNGFPYTDLSSLSNALPDARWSHAQLLHDSMSFGSFLEFNGIRATPSVQEPYPEDEKFYSGGYSTRRHTAADAAPVFGLQIELNLDLRENSQSRRDAATRTAGALIQYLNLLWSGDQWAMRSVEMKK